MASAARIGDIFVGVCCCHVKPTCVGMAGIIVSGASNATIENSSAARIGDVGVGFCGHATVVASGSMIANSSAGGNSRIGDVVAGCVNGVIVTGASRTMIGG